MSRTRSLLLIVVLLLAIGYAWNEYPRQQQVANSTASDPRRSVSSVASGPGVDLALDFSGGEKLPYKKPKRDLFRALYRAPRVVKSVAVAAPIPAPAVVELPPPVVIRPVVRGPVVNKSIPPLNVLGFLRKSGRMTVFLTTSQGDLYLVKKGDRFADGLLVRELTETQMIVSRGQDDTGVALTIGEPKTQRMPVPKVSSGRPSVPTYTSPVPEAEIPAVDSEKVEVDP